MTRGNWSGWPRAVAWGAMVTASLAGLGCSATPVGFAVSLAGEAVNDLDARQRAKDLTGARASQADASLGEPVEVLTDTRSSREWRLYRVPGDVLDTSRYVVEVTSGSVGAVVKVQQYSDPVQYEALLAVIRPKVMGKGPGECEANLDMGSSLLTVRSRSTGQTIRLYDARVIRDLQVPHYCVLRFGSNNLCEKVNLVKAYAPDGQGLTR